MTLSPPQWIMAFAAALTVHALTAVTLPQALFRRNSEPPPPEPILVSLATPPAPASPTPAVTPPAPRPPVARQPEPEVTPPTPKAVEQPPPEPEVAVAPIQPAPAPQPAVTAVNPTPVAIPQTPAREATTAVNEDITPLTTITTEEPPPTTTAAAPTPILDNVDLAQLQSEYKIAAAEQVERHKRYPQSLQRRGFEGKVLVTVSINRNGEFSEPPSVIHTDNIRLNKEALASIRRAAPFPPFPDEMAKIRETWEMVITISFNLR